MAKGAKTKENSANIFLKKYFFWGIIIILLILSFLVIRPYLIALVSSFILAYLVKPVFDKITPKLGKRLSAFICTLLIILIIILPLIAVVSEVISQINFSPNLEFVFSKLSESSFFTKFDINDLQNKAALFLVGILSSVISYLPTLIITSLITILGVYYILISWDKLSSKLENILPFPNKQRVKDDISSITKSIVHGYLFIALLEFAVGVIGFYLSGVKLFFLLPLLIALFAFIPGIGPELVWVPTMLYYFFTGNYYTALGVLITGLIISIVIEALLLSKVIGRKARIHPLVFLLGVFGGVPIFGIFGFVIGPLILVYTIKLLEEAINQANK
jgi:predicted PurR-regulated permease PerM